MIPALATTYISLLIEYPNTIEEIDIVAREETRRVLRPSLSMRKIAGRVMTRLTRVTKRAVFLAEAGLTAVRILSNRGEGKG